jgi:hypothetical protein
LIIQQWEAKSITPELSTHFDSDMVVVLEKWVPKSQFQLFIIGENNVITLNVS